MVLGDIDPGLPYIKDRGVKALDPVNPTIEEAYGKIEAIKKFYQDNYPKVFQEKEGAVDVAIDSLKRIARLTTFPDMHVDWNTYKSNAGHQDSPGCMRCHGKLTATSGETRGKVVDAECDSCHYFQLPQIK